MDEKLRIGRIPYSNLFPIFHILQAESDCSGYEFIEGYPSTLNRMLREGALDISPSSSVEYLRREGEYICLEGHSISSRGPVGSILLFSPVPIEAMGGREVLVTHQSETSVALLDVIMRKFHSTRCELRVSSRPLSEAVAAGSPYLAIGDDALLATRETPGLEAETYGPGRRVRSISGRRFHIYDLGEIWRERTGLPFVFALWIARKDSASGKERLMERLRDGLEMSRELLPERLPLIAGEPGLVLPPEEMLEYWRGIIYGLGEDCLEGLNLFRGYLSELGLL